MFGAHPGFARGLGDAARLVKDDDEFGVERHLLPLRVDEVEGRVPPRRIACQRLGRCRQVVEPEGPLGRPLR